MGCNVAVLCAVPGHPAQKARGIARVFPYNGFHPLTSLRTAIRTFDPDVLVPCCDRSVQHLHELHAISQLQGAAGKEIVALIEHSLGSSDSFAIVSSRRELLETARAEGILVPEMSAIRSVSDLKRWSAESAPPWVIKADGTWGGRGVRIANTRAEAEHCFLELTERTGELELIKRMILNRNRDWILYDRKRSRPAAVAQVLINGRPANCVVVCKGGKLLAGTAVEVIRAQGPTGPATVVQVVEGAEMMQAAQRIARRLGLSGFFGLDFIIENGTDATYLIEMNPRCAPPCHLPLGKGRDLVAAMWSDLTGKPQPQIQSVTNKRRVAYFPQNHDDVDDPLGARWDATYSDIPNGEPELIHELLHPWSERSIVGRLVDRFRQHGKEGKYIDCVCD